MKKFLFTLLISFSAINAFACTPGAGNGPAGDPNCMGAILSTDPYYNNQNRTGSAAQPKKIIRYTEVEVPPKYGALALDENTGALGGAVDADSLAQAQKDAIRQCNSKGCKVVTWVKNGCIAAAGGKLGNHWKLSKAAENRGNAERVAMNRCKKAGISNCQIIVPEACSIPDISKY